MRVRHSVLFYLLSLVTLAVSCTHRDNTPGYISIAPRIRSFNAKEQSTTKKEPDPLVFTSGTLNIGTCKRDTDTTFSCHFINRGRERVLIERVTGSCGCLAFDYKQKDLLPGEKSSIKVKFSSGYLEGFFKKEIYICLKSGKIITLSFFVNVAGSKAG